MFYITTHLVHFADYISFSFTIPTHFYCNKFALSYTTYCRLHFYTILHMRIHSTTTRVTFYIYSTHFLTHTSISPPLLSLFFSFSFLFPTGRKIRHLFTKIFRVFLNTYKLLIRVYSLIQILPDPRHVLLQHLDFPIQDRVLILHPLQLPMEFHQPFIIQPVPVLLHILLELLPPLHSLLHCIWRRTRHHPSPIPRHLLPLEARAQERLTHRRPCHRVRISPFLTVENTLVCDGQRRRRHIEVYARLTCKRRTPEKH